MSVPRFYDTVSPRVYNKHNLTRKLLHEVTFCSPPPPSFGPYTDAVAHYATRRKVAVSTSDEVSELFSIYLILPAALGPGVHSASNRNEYQKQKNNVSGE
jgi:hypothetical protein